MVSAESGGRLSTWEVASVKLIYSVLQQPNGEILQVILLSNNKQFIVLSRAATSSTTTCTGRLLSSDDVVYQFEYKAPLGALFCKVGVLTKDEKNLVVAAMDAESATPIDSDQKPGTEYRLQLFNAYSGLHQCDITLRYSNFRPFSRLVALRADFDNQQFIAVIDDYKGNILDVNKRTGDRTL